MDSLLLIRHAKAVPPSLACSDARRPLSGRGRADAACLGAQLADAGLAPKQLLLSPSQRTEETWAEMEDKFEAPEILRGERLYLATMPALKAMCQAALTGDGPVWVIGHNPGLRELLHYLVDPETLPAPLNESFPTGVAVSLKVDGPSLRRVGFDRLVAPRTTGRETSTDELRLS